jgi:hypothetical protein
MDPLLGTTPMPLSISTVVAPSTFQDRVASVPDVTSLGETRNLVIARSCLLLKRPSSWVHPPAMRPVATTNRKGFDVIILNDCRYLGPYSQVLL